MRKINTILVIIIMVLLLDHIVFGGMYLLSKGPGVLTPLALTMVGLVVLHAIISLIVTIRAEKAGFKTGARYQKENNEFWLRRSSGMAILIFALTHAYSMLRNERGIPNIAFMPKIFQLTLPLLIVSISVHLLCNIKPLLISMGVRNVKRKEKIIRIIVILITVFALAAYTYFGIKRHRGGLI